MIRFLVGFAVGLVVAIVWRWARGRLADRRLMARGPTLDRYGVLLDCKRRKREGDRAYRARLSEALRGVKAPP